MRALREELVLLHEPGSHVGEVVKVMGKEKVQACWLWAFAFARGFDRTCEGQRDYRSVFTRKIDDVHAVCGFWGEDGEVYVGFPEDVVLNRQAGARVCGRTHALERF